MSYVECVQNCTHQTHMSHVKSRHQGLVLIINVELSLQTEVSFNIINTMLRSNERWGSMGDPFELSCVDHGVSHARGEVNYNDRCVT